MKKLVILAAVFFCTSISHAVETPDPFRQQILPAQSLQIIQTACNETGLTLFQKEELGQRGCCSWHGGVCGCQGGSVVCCDGTYSPSCSCRSDDRPSETK